MRWFDTAAFMPHGQCYLWRADVVWLHVLSDAITAVAYFSLPVAIYLILQKRRESQLRTVGLLFAAFIILCGASHAVSIVTVWYPVYIAQGLVKSATAAASIVTAVVVMLNYKDILAFPASTQLKEKNDALHQLNTSLEERVEARGLENAYLATLVESSTEGITATDNDFNITVWNKGAEILYGYTKKEAIGQNVSLIEAPGFDMTKLREELKDGRQISDLETKQRRKDGQIVEVSTSISPIIDRHGKRVGFSAISRDVRERHRLEGQRDEYRHTLQVKNEELEQFVYTISHDLKSPIVTCMSFLSFLKDDLAAGKKEDIEDSLGELTTGLTKLRALIEDLLHLSRVGRVSLESKEVNTRDLLDQLARQLELRDPDRNIKINIADDLPNLVGDEGKVTQVFENLLNNAINYCAEDRSPVIDILNMPSRPGEFVIGIKDNGIGIEEAYQHKVFQLFQRLATDSDGTGIGLTIVKRVMEMHGGSVSLISKLGEGSTFSLHFPKNAESPLS